MAKQERLMITGTEGQPDYLVVARKNGYVLGIKPLLQCGLDNSAFGFRLRLQKAETGQDIANKQADAEGMTQVFSGVPWSKRSSKRFSTVVTMTVGWGVEFQNQLLGEIQDNLDDMLQQVSETFKEDEEWLDYDDMFSFLNDAYSVLADKHAQAYQEYLAANEGKGESSQAGQVVAFPVGDTDDID